MFMVLKGEWSLTCLWSQPTVIIEQTALTSTTKTGSCPLGEPDRQVREGQKCWVKRTTRESKGLVEKRRKMKRYCGKADRGTEAGKEVLAKWWQRSGDCTWEWISTLQSLNTVIHLARRRDTQAPKIRYGLIQLIHAQIDWHSKWNQNGKVLDWV